MKPEYIEFLKKQATQEDFNGEQARRQLDKLGIPYDEPLPPPTVFFDTNKDKSNFFKDWENAIRQMKL